MKTFIAFLAILAAARADVTSHATVKHGDSPGYSHAVAHKPTHQTYKPRTYNPPTYHQPVYTTTTYKPATYAAPTYKPATYAPPTYKSTYKPSYKEPEYNEPPKYNYEYAVADEYAGVNFGASEGRDGYSTTGEYRVLLPDCRTQIVKYNTADGYSGNIVEVTYEGTPCYDTYKHEPTYKPPTYKPHPVYKPAPSYHA